MCKINRNCACACACMLNAANVWIRLFISLFGTCFLAFQFWLTTAEQKWGMIQSLFFHYCIVIFVCDCTGLLTQTHTGTRLRTCTLLVLNRSARLLACSVARSFAHSWYSRERIYCKLVLINEIQFGLFRAPESRKEGEKERVREILMWKGEWKREKERAPHW